ncbi:MAG TPA: hypothetical protein VJ672_06850 [Gemmatimonadaceae bacterium]|nr:hypothetical protein [Gemmatimonadaceae bacterium]
MVLPHAARPSRSRIRIAKEIGGISITISARRHWGIILFLGFWLCGWVMGESFALKTLLTGRANDAGMGGTVFLSIWLVFWTLGGIVAWYMWLWSLTGEETIVIGREALSIRRTVLGMGRTTLVMMRHVRNVRAIEVDDGIHRGRIVVDTNGRSYGFGSDLTESEADYLIAAIRSEVEFSIPEDPPASILEPAAIPA